MHEEESEMCVRVNENENEMCDKNRSSQRQWFVVNLTHSSEHASNMTIEEIHCIRYMLYS